MIAPEQTQKNDVQRIKAHVPVVLPKYFWRCLQIIGVLPVDYPRPAESPESSRVNWCLIAYSVVLLCLGMAYSVIRIGNYIDLYLDQIKDLEFFSLISFVCFVSSQIQIPIIFTIMYTKGRRIPKLLYKLSSSLISNPNSIKRERPKWSQIAVPLALIWILITVIAPFLHFRHTVTEEDKLSEDDNETWTSPEPIFFGLIVGPYWLWKASETLHRSFILSVTNSSQMLTFLIVLAVGKSFRNHARLLKVADSTSKAALEKWVFCRRSTAALLDIVQMTNDIFAWMNVFVCVQDLLNLIHYMALLLEEVTYEKKDDYGVFIERYVFQRIFVVQDIDPFVMSIINLALRFAVCSYCNEQGQQVGFLAQQCCLQSDDPKVQDECQKIQTAISRNGSTTISAGGFSQITKEYLAALVGLLLTYFILLYQARDSKQEMRKLKEGIKADMRIQIQKLLNSSYGFRS